jgi:hypothetical protein
MSVSLSICRSDTRHPSASSVWCLQSEMTGVVRARMLQHPSATAEELGPAAVGGPVAAAIDELKSTIAAATAAGAKAAAAAAISNTTRDAAAKARAGVAVAAAQGKLAEIEGSPREFIGKSLTASLAHLKTDEAPATAYMKALTNAGTDLSGVAEGGTGGNGSALGNTVKT